MTVFDDLKNAMGDLVGDPTLGGYLLGGVVVGAFLVAFIMLSGKEPVPVILGMGFGVVLSVLFGWWEPWTIVFIGLLLAFLLIRPFTSVTSDSGGV